MLRGATRVSCCLAGCRRSFGTPSLAHDDLLEALRRLDTASLCDADKILRQKAADAGTTKDACDGKLYRGIQLMDTKIRPINPAASNTKLVGYAFTVQCTVKNDFLAVLRGLHGHRARVALHVAAAGAGRHAVAVEARVAGLPVDEAQVGPQHLEDVAVLVVSLGRFQGLLYRRGDFFDIGRFGIGGQNVDHH